MNATLAQYAIAIYSFVGNTWQAALWDCLPVVLWAISGYVFFVRGGRIAIGRKRFTVGWLLVFGAAILNATDEFLGLNDIPLLGRHSVWHEGVETVCAVIGLALVLSAVNRWVRYT